MSGRSTSYRLRHKVRAAANSPQAKGKAAARAGLTTRDCPHDGAGFGKRHAWLRGFAAERLKMTKERLRAAAKEKPCNHDAFSDGNRLVVESHWAAGVRLRCTKCGRTADVRPKSGRVVPDKPQLSDVLHETLAAAVDEQIMAGSLQPRYRG